MSETIPPVGGNPSPPQTCGLAVWSLVLGILSLFLCVLSIFTAIPGVICGHKALSRIKYSGGALDGQGMAIGGLVTGYLGIFLALISIPLLFAIAIPNFVRAREMVKNRTILQQNMISMEPILTQQHHAATHRGACINNLRLIVAAKQQWALEQRQTSDATPKWDDLRPYLGHGPNGELPVCPDGGVYTIGTVGEKPTCSIPGHVLP